MVLLKRLSNGIKITLSMQNLDGTSSSNVILRMLFVTWVSQFFSFEALLA